MINEDKIRKACSSDRERGFRLLVDSFQEPIYNYIRRMVVSHEDAEDVLQEVFIRVFRHLDQFRKIQRQALFRKKHGSTELQRMSVFGY